ncbi:unnamed protein product, partial [Symbiodinium sp. KB8]
MPKRKACIQLAAGAAWMLRLEEKENPEKKGQTAKSYPLTLAGLYVKYAFCCSCIFPKPTTLKFLALRHRALPAMLPLLLWRLKQLRAPKACYGSLRLFESGMLFKKYAGSLGQVLMMLVLLLSWSSNVECFAQVFGFIEFFAGLGNCSRCYKLAGVPTASLDILYNRAPEGKDNYMDILSNAGMAMAVLTVLNGKPDQSLVLLALKYPSVKEANLMMSRHYPMKFARKMLRMLPKLQKAKKAAPVPPADVSAQEIFSSASFRDYWLDAKMDACIHYVRGNAAMRIPEDWQWSCSELTAGYAKLKQVKTEDVDAPELLKKREALQQKLQ